MHNIFIKRVLLRQIEWRSVTSSSRYLANPIKMVGTRLLVLAAVAVCLSQMEVTSGQASGAGSISPRSLPTDFGFDPQSALLMDLISPQTGGHGSSSSTTKLPWMKMKVTTDAGKDLNHKSS